MYAADHIVDIGPEAGINGGELVAQGTVRGHHQLPAIHYRSVSQREEEDRGSCKASQGERQEDRDHRCIREQSKRYRCQDPAWRNGLCDRCIRIRVKAASSTKFYIRPLQKKCMAARRKPGKYKKIKGN